MRPDDPREEFRHVCSIRSVAGEAHGFDREIKRRLARSNPTVKETCVANRLIIYIYIYIYIYISACSAHTISMTYAVCHRPHTSAVCPFPRTEVRSVRPAQGSSRHRDPFPLQVFCRRDAASVQVQGVDQQRAVYYGGTCWINPVGVIE